MNLGSAVPAFSLLLTFFAHGQTAPQYFAPPLEVTLAWSADRTNGVAGAKAPVNAYVPGPQSTVGSRVLKTWPDRYSRRSPRKRSYPRRISRSGQQLRHRRRRLR